MLFDGAIRFAEQGKAALEKSDFQASYLALSKAQKIINELNSNLRHDIYPELCGKLASLYNFAHRNLVEANIHHQTEPVDEALKVIRYQRETWVLLMQQLQQSKGDAAAAGQPAAEETGAEASISMQA